MTEEHVDVEFGRAVKAARRAAGIRTQAELGDMLGVGQKMVQHYEAGRYLTPETRRALMAHLGEHLAPGDPVEAALDKSGLVKWRAGEVKVLYWKHQEAQAREEAG